MLFSTSCKQGKLQLTEDGYLQVIALFSKQPTWREPVSAIKAISVQKGRVMCAIAIHASLDRYAENLSKSDIDKLKAVLPMIRFNDVAALPSQVQPAQVPGPLPAQPLPPMPVPSAHPTLKIASKGNTLTLTQDGYLQLARPFGNVLWSVLARQVTGLRAEKKFPALTVTIDTPGGSYTAEMVSNQDFEKLRAALAAYQ